jgi:hypothetical protein
MAKRYTIQDVGEMVAKIAENVTTLQIDMTAVTKRLDTIEMHVTGTSPSDRLPGRVFDLERRMEAVERKTKAK